MKTLLFPFATSAIFFLACGGARPDVESAGASAQTAPALDPVATRAPNTPSPGNEAESSTTLEDSGPPEGMTPAAATAPPESTPRTITLASPDNVGDPAAVEPEPPPPPLPAGTTVLHIGDSFAGALGIELNRLFADRGVRGILRYETSSYIPTWANSKELPKHIDRFRPDLVLITLGANELDVPDPQERVAAVRRLVARIGDRPCVWVAPPLWEGARDALLPVIEQNCAPCVYMSSSSIEKALERMHDKIHPSMQARKDWALHVLTWLEQHRDPRGVRQWDITRDK